MLASPWPEPFSDDRWFFEPKWDGVRALLVHDEDGVSLRSRRGNDLTPRFPELTQRLRDPLVLDGEIVVLEPDGSPSFDRLQMRSGRFASVAPEAHPVTLVVFDVLHRATRSLIAEPLEFRLEVLASLELPSRLVRSDPIVGAGLELWEAVTERHLEGIVAKRRGSRYQPGIRSENWRKVANVLTAKVVVGGFTRGGGARAATFGSLLVGLWDEGRLRWTGAVGTGFSTTELEAIRSALDQQLREDSPFHADDGLPLDALWVEPALVAAVGYRNWTRAGRLRQPRFRGFTDDPVDGITWAEEGPGG